MDRRKFIDITAVLSGALAAKSFSGFADTFFISPRRATPTHGSELKADLVIAGGGLGGCAAAIAALQNGLNVIMTEETDWIGGQLTSQGVPPDEHQWIETHGATRLYRLFRSNVRQYYRNNYPLTETARSDKYLNPGNGSVSRLCHEPKVALAVLNEMLAPYLSSNKLLLLTEHKINRADVNGCRIHSLEAENQRNGDILSLSAPFFIDATELGDLLPLTGTAFTTGSESRADTKELHAAEYADPESNQAFTACFALEYLPGEDYVIEKPMEYDLWRGYTPGLMPPWPGKLLSMKYSSPSTLEPKELGFNPEGSDTSPFLNLWTYRRIISKDNFQPGIFKSDVSLVNWPQNDYMKGNLISPDPQVFRKQFENAKQLSLSLLYWLQTEIPRPGKGYGWPGLKLCPGIMGTTDGIAKHPYVRESRRIKALFRVLEEHVGKENRLMIAGKKKGAVSAYFTDSVGIGYYHIDLHPTCNGNNYIDFDSLPFQIPMGALIPEMTENLLAANKNIGTTHITNGCYRLHPVEWNIGESAGHLAAFSLRKKIKPGEIRDNKKLLREFQSRIRMAGIETEWA
jgi:hypothetical protein